MAILPGVQWNPVSPVPDPLTRLDIVCLHTIVGPGPASAAHISVLWDGHRIQHRDSLRRSAANLDGNYHIFAIETADRGEGFPVWNKDDGRAVPEWRPEQCEAIATTLADLHKLHNVPLSLVPNSIPGHRGIAYHRQGIDGNWAGYEFPGRISGGEIWSNSIGKVCPGDRRISQLITTVIPRARALAGLDTDMSLTPEQHNWLATIYQQITGDEDWSGPDGWGWRDFIDGTPRTPVDLLRIIHREIQARYGLSGRPAQEVDTMFGHVLDTHAILRDLRASLITEFRAWLDANPPTVSVDVQAIANAVWAQARDNDPSTGPVS